mgnify:CR=1 FL=1
MAFDDINLSSACLEREDLMRSIESVDMNQHLQNDNVVDNSNNKSKTSKSSNIVVLEFPVWDKREYTSNDFPDDVNIENARKTLTEILNRNFACIDFYFEPKNTKWECIFTKNSILVHFIIHFWKKDKFFLEFSHRSGDLLTFNEIYNKITNLMQNANYDPLLLPVEMNQNQLSTSFIIPLSDKYSDKYIEQMIHMLDGDTKSNLGATRFFAYLSLNLDNLKIICNEKVINSLVSILKFYKDDNEYPAIEIMWNAITCLDNLTLLEDYHNKLLRSAMTQKSHCNLFFELIDKGSYKDMAIRRKSASIIRNMVQQDASIIIELLGKDYLIQWYGKIINEINDKLIKDDVDYIWSIIFPKL